MKLSLKLYMALGCMLIASLPALPQSLSNSIYAGHVTVTNGVASFTFSANATNGRTFHVTNSIGDAGTNSMVTTNLDGFWVVLASPTNVHVLGKPILCRLFICNASGARLAFSWSDAAEDTTGFGRFVVHHGLSKEDVAFKKLPPTRFGHSRGGGFGPGANRLFEFDLNRLFEFNALGEYAVVFRGQVPSVQDPVRKIDFETPPLLITVGPPKGSPSPVSPRTATNSANPDR